MPNNVTNQITFGSDSAALAAFQQMLRDMQMNGEPLGSIDFNKLSPMPEELNMESGGRTDQGLKLVREYHRALVDLERREPPLTAAEYELELSQCEDLYREKRVADPEAWALGELTLMGGEVIDSNIPADGSREAYEMSAEIMEINLSDHHLHLTKDGTSYEYRAPDGAPSAGRSSPEPLPVPKKQEKTSGEKRGSKGQER